MKSNKTYLKWFFAAAVVVMGFSITACEDEPDKYEVAGGVPTVKYVRVPDPAAADSLLVGAYMDNTICLVGDNLRSIYELYFNDQKAILNTSYMTDHTVLVDVPGGIPATVTDKIYMITKDNQTVEYDFKVIVPAPQVASMSCEYAHPGTEVTIYGDYLLDDPNVPLTITMAGNVPVTDIRKITKTAVSFILPDNAPEGYITVGSIYGNSRSAFRYHDTRNILFDWDGSHGGITIGHGWREGVVRDDELGIDGAYLYFGGVDMLGEIGATWAEENFSFNYWPEVYEKPEGAEIELAKEYPELSSRPEFASLISEYGIAGLQLKFELLVPSSNPWKSSALQMMFTSNASVTHPTQNNAFYSDVSVPRGLWMPWSSTGSYDTADKWITVSFRLSDFNKTHEGAACGTTFSADYLTGLTFFVWHGGVAGTDCDPVLCIDNIRVVPIE